MCDAKHKLIAWLDHELLPEDAARVERHVEACKECRLRLVAYEQASKTFDAYCQAAVTKNTRHRLPGWVPVVSGAVVAVCLAIVLVMRTFVESQAIVTPPLATTSVPVVVPVEPQITPRKAIQRHHRLVSVPVRASATNWQPAEIAVQIAIPAESMFAPGALPQGVNFAAELRIAPDGSVQQVRLRQ
jgi:anti-sigma factor RsiW